MTDDHDPADDEFDDFFVPDEQEDDEPFEAPDAPEQYASAPRDASPSFVHLSCVTCGYNLTGIAIGGVCPECGANVDESLYASGQSPPNGFAITSLVLGIISVVGLCCCWGGFLGIPGLIFGFIAMSQLKSNSYSAGSYGMALAGLICSGISLGLTSVFVFLAILDAL